MREEVRAWLAQATEDERTAAELLQRERYYAAAFFAQQAAEKSLKALYIHTQRAQKVTHDLVELTSALGAPEAVRHAARELNSDYTVTRYPDAANGVPAEQFDDAIATEHVAFARAICAWVNQSLSP